MNIHLCIVDRSVDSKDPRSTDYVSIPMSWDMAGQITRVAERNGSDPRSLRMYVFAKKRDWEKAKRHYYDTVADWSLLDKPVPRHKNTQQP